MKSKFLLIPMLLALLAGLTLAQSGSTGSSVSSSPAAATNSAAPSAAPGTTSTPIQPEASNTRADLPQPRLVTPTVENRTTGLDALNQNFNNIPSLDEQFRNTFGDTFDNTGLNNAGMTSTVDQFGNRVDEFGNPMLATGTILINGIPVTVNNPFANPFNLGIVLDQGITGTTLNSQNLNAALTNPNLPLNVSNIETNSELTNSNQDIVDASDSSLSIGVQFPAITVGNSPQTSSQGYQSSIISRQGASVSTLSNRTGVRGITRRGDGTFTNRRR